MIYFKKLDTLNKIILCNIQYILIYLENYIFLWEQIIFRDCKMEGFKLCADGVFIFVEKLEF